MEEANAGDAGGSGSNTGPGVFEGDATQCKDRNGRGSGADGVKPVEAMSGDDLIVGEFLFEDRGEEDCVDLVFAGASHFVESVTGDCDNGALQFGQGIKSANLGGSTLVGFRGEVDAMSAGRDGDIAAGVDQEFGCGGFQGDGLENFTGEGSDGSGGKIFFAELDRKSVV